MIEVLRDTLVTEAPTLMMEGEEEYGSDSVTYHGFSVWRIVRSMPGATPSQLDSAIQARLPEREKVRSTRPDTLEIPGIKARDPYAFIDSLPAGYRQGFFAQNPMLHPELVVRPSGYVAHPLPYQLWSDDWVTGGILLCFLVMVYLYSQAKKFFMLQARNFVFPTKELLGAAPVETGLESSSVVFFFLLLSLQGGLLTFGYSQYALSIFLGQLSPYLLLGIYMGSWLVYFLCKRLLYSFTNWIFFNKQQRRLWNESYNFLVCAESLVLFPIVLIFVYFSPPLKFTIYAVLALIIGAKALLAYKCFSIFFKNMLGALHLFVYLCALEMSPLVIIWLVLTKITDILILKF